MFAIYTFNNVFMKYTTQNIQSILEITKCGLK